jgi:hypothetical protein
VTRTGFRIFLDVGSGFLDDVNRFVLLFDQDAHLRVGVSKITIFRASTYVIEQLRQFSQRAFNLLNVLVPLLNFPVGSLRLAVSVGAHQLQQTVSA